MQAPLMCAGAFERYKNESPFVRAGIFRQIMMQETMPAIGIINPHFGGVDIAKILSGGNMCGEDNALDIRRNIPQLNRNFLIIPIAQPLDVIAAVINLAAFINRKIPIGGHFGNKVFIRIKYKAR